MRLVDFIKMLDKDMVESAHISFKLLLPLRYGGKWFFYCNDGDTVDDICKFVKEKNINIPIVWPYNELVIDDDEVDENGNTVYKYTFDFTNIPEDWTDFMQK